MLRLNAERAECIKFNIKRTAPKCRRLSVDDSDICHWMASDIAAQ